MDNDPEVAKLTEQELTRWSSLRAEIRAVNVQLKQAYEESNRILDKIDTDGVYRKTLAGIVSMNVQVSRYVASNKVCVDEISTRLKMDLNLCAVDPETGVVRPLTPPN